MKCTVIRVRLSAYMARLNNRFRYYILSPIYESTITIHSTGTVWHDFIYSFFLSFIKKKPHKPFDKPETGKNRRYFLNL